MGSPGVRRPCHRKARKRLPRPSPSPWAGAGSSAAGAARPHTFAARWFGRNINWRPWNPRRIGGTAEAASGATLGGHFETTHPVDHRDNEAIVAAEFKGFLKRCRAQGVSSSEAEHVLSIKVARVVPAHANVERRAHAVSRSGGYSRNLGTQYLESAMAAAKANDAAAYKAACSSWLFMERGLKVGDVLLLHAGKPDERELLLERFELHWPRGQTVFTPSLVFLGPTVRLRPRRVVRDIHWCGRDDPTVKQDCPSGFLSQQLRTLPP
jgi:hypothetical protein